jgi:hypothetical protein
VSGGSPLLADQFRLQARYCALLGSPLYERLLDHAADDLAAGGPVASVMRGHEDDEPRSMPHLRLLGAVHRLVLAGEAPELATFYPSAGGTADGQRAWPAFLELIVRERERLREELRAPVQTNEVGRSAGLLGGFLLMAGRFGLPLRILEVGASAGLILRFDSYGYADGARSWGPSGSSVRFEDFLAGGVAEAANFPFEVEAAVAERAGCDASPLDPRSERDQLVLRGFVWPDQAERFQTLSAALAAAAEDPVPVERADAADWVERQLERPHPGVATVIYHSLVMMYMSDPSRERMIAAIERAGRSAGEDAPVAWLRMELGGDEADVHLTVWPGGEEAKIARAGYHGKPVRWMPDG